ncbi:predicted protein [Arabidopsis lyrata subsp. lyrata]|uniref:Predicted protein n=1 Tax=Arabidopsis lyrata subsp. lyrata TaxID=81972 RepID=D7MQ67_ARALL|nr:predicted protein [Arabidopsis lyrata subsp. lyrata]
MKTRGGKGKRGRGSGSKIPPQNRPTSSGTSNRRPSTLPSQYTFTPANPDAPETQQRSIHRLASRSNQPPAPVQPPASTQHAASNRQIPSRQQRPSPQPRASVSHHSSQAQNSHEESEDEEAEGESEEDVLRDSTLPEDVLATLHDTLLIPALYYSHLSDFRAWDDMV